MIDETRSPSDALPPRPALAPAVTVEEPRSPDGPWIIAHDGVPKARVSSEVAAAARRFTGRDDIAEVARALGAPWTEADVIEVARSLDRGGLLHDERGGGRVARRRTGPFRYRPPLTVQWSWGDPGRVFAALRPLTRTVLTAPGAIAAAVLVVAGGGAAVRDADRIGAVLGQPLDLALLPVVLVALLLTTLLHEAGHGSVLSAFGGTPRRIGAMLFYLAPAFFCDVTDGWRLSHRRERVAVALAGPAVHLLCGATALLAAAAVAHAGAHAALVLYALSCLAIALLNLLPFVQLDGYLALMAALDRPHLRRHAIAAAGETLSELFFGTARADSATPVPRRAWATVYGILCAIFPVTLVAWVLHRTAAMLAGAGAAAAVAYATMLAVVAVVAMRGLVRSIRRVRQAQPAPGRTLVALAIAVGATTGLLLVPVPVVHEAGVVVHGADARLVIATGREVPDAGAHVALETRGILLRRALGTAEVGTAPAERDQVDAAALVPLRPTGLTADVLTLPLVDVVSDAPLPAFGVATIADGTTRPLAVCVWDEYVAGPLRTLIPKGGTS